MNKKRELKTGCILLAEPFLWDNNFKRAAIFVTEFDKKGSVGFVLNKPIDMNITQLIKDFPEFEAEVSFGGPVQTDTIHYVHSIGHLLDDSIPITEGVWWGGDFTKLKALIRSGVVKSEDIRFFVGYTGWSGGQLEEEIEIGSWVVADMDLNYIFNPRENKKLWQEIMEHKGDNFAIIGQMPDAANWN